MDAEFEVVGEAADGAEAVRLARELRPDVVLMDLIMPVMDGITAIKTIRNELPEVEVIALTSVMEDASVIGAIQAGAMGALGLILALVGVYGVVSYGAAQRTREIGIRMALGATPQAVLRIILNQGVGLIITGVAIGLAGAIALRRVLARFLLNASAADPVALVAVPALLALVALFACYLPARRAMRVDPMTALRHE